MDLHLSKPKPRGNMWPGMVSARDSENQLGRDVPSPCVLFDSGPGGTKWGGLT